MSCIKYEPSNEGCGECDHAEDYHPLTADGNPNPTWGVPPFSQWNPVTDHGHHSWWGDFVIMDGYQFTHVADCDCDGEEEPPDPRCEPGPPTIGLWLDTGAHGYMHIRDLDAAEISTLDIA